MAKRFFNKKEKKDTSIPIERVQAERIEELKRENYSLTLELAKFHSRESEITKALNFAQSKAKELEDEAKRRYTLEYERLENYRAKWTGAVQSLEKAESLGEQVIKTEKYLRQCAKELKDIINDNIPFDSPPHQDYYKETARLMLEPETSCEPLCELDADALTDEELQRLVKQLLEASVEA